MNEFEMAELALMEKSYLLELESVTQTYVSNTQTEGTILISLIFGYLLVAHFVGASITRAQVTILNALYLFTVVSGLAVYRGHYESIIFSVNRLLEVKGLTASDIPITGTPGAVQVVIVAYSAMILASLYFMWTVRHPKAE